MSQDPFWELDEETKQNILRDYKTTAQDSFEIGEIKYEPCKIISMTDDILVCQGSFKGFPVSVKLIPLNIPGRLNHNSNIFEDLKNLYHVCNRDADSNHIVRVLHMEKDANLIYVVMECPNYCLKELSKEEVISNFANFVIDDVDLMRQIVYGLRDLHSSGIIHRNLHTDAMWVFVTKRSLLVKIADIGIMGHHSCKAIEADLAGKNVGNWGAPRKASNLMGGEEDDVYMLAQVMESFLNRYGAKKVQATTRHLLDQMVVRQPHSRPTIIQVLEHPYFWPSEKSLRFLIEVSDIATNNKDFQLMSHKIHNGQWRGWRAEIDLTIMQALDRNRHAYLVGIGNRNPSLYRNELVDLLSAIRNISTHFTEYDQGTQSFLQSRYSGVGSYFMSKFDKLLIVLYKHALRRYQQNLGFREYLKFG